MEGLITELLGTETTEEQVGNVPPTSAQSPQLIRTLHIQRDDQSENPSSACVRHARTASDACVPASETGVFHSIWDKESMVSTQK